MGISHKQKGRGKTRRFATLVGEVVLDESREHRSHEQRSLASPRGAKRNGGPAEVNPGVRIRDEAYVRWRQSCPCCGARMTSRPPKRGAPVPLSYRTVGHDVPVAKGGSAHNWLYICNGCNTAQGVLSFADWADRLRWQEAGRGNASGISKATAERVQRVADFMTKMQAELELNP